MGASKTPVVDIALRELNRAILDLIGQSESLIRPSGSLLGYSGEPECNWE